MTDSERDRETGPVAPAAAPEEDPRIEGEKHPIGRMIGIGLVASVIGVAIVLWIDWFPVPAVRVGAATSTRSTTSC